MSDLTDLTYLRVLEQRFAQYFPVCHRKPKALEKSILAARFFFGQEVADSSLCDDCLFGVGQPHETFFTVTRFYGQETASRIWCNRCIKGGVVVWSA